MDALHRAIDLAAASVAARHVGRLHCGRGCAACCRDELTVFEIEAEIIRRRHASLLTTGRPHALGACAMLDEQGACRIYADRPYVCRTQGLPLRWLDAAPDSAVVEHRDICELNDLGVALLELEPAACWTIGPFEARLRSIAQRRSGRLERVALRALFRRQAAE